MRYRNVVVRVCRDGCFNQIGDNHCFLYNDYLTKIKVGDKEYLIACENCLYKRNKVREDNTAPLFREESNV